MDNKSKAILWDFDGTLVQHTSWRGALMDVLDENEPGHNIDQEQIRPFFRDGFPWLKPEEPHLYMLEPEAWWANLEPLFVRAFKGVGFIGARAVVLARQVRGHMINPRRYTLYNDTIPVLEQLRENGWKNVILSNHMPELPEVVSALEFGHLIDKCISSALTGYEKPNPRAFRLALDTVNDSENIWMVGDNIVSDIKGAEAMGIPAILVHNPKTENIKYQAGSLVDTANIIEGNETRE